MELIDREAVLDYMKGWKGETVEFVRNLPAINAIPIKPLSVWLAAYAAPPEYALETVIRDGADPTSLVYTVNNRAKAWELHLKTLIKCGFMEEEHGTDNP